LKPPNWLKKGWRLAADAGSVAQLGLAVLGGGGIFSGIWSWLSSLLTETPSKPPRLWPIETWAVLAFEFAVTVAWVITFGYWLAKKRYALRIIGKTLSIVPEYGGNWSKHTLKGKRPGIRLETGLYVTNIHNEPISVVRCQIMKYGQWGHLSIVHPNLGVRNIDYEFPSKKKVLVATVFNVSNIRPTNRQKIVSDLCLTDNLGNDHIVKDCVFEYQVPEKKPKSRHFPSTPTSQASIQDPKNLAASIQKILPKSFATDLSIATRLSEEVEKVLSKQPGIDIAWLLGARSSELQNALSKMDLAKGIDVNSKGWAELMKKLVDDPSKEQREK